MESIVTPIVKSVENSIYAKQINNTRSIDINKYLMSLMSIKNPWGSISRGSSQTMPQTDGSQVQVPSGVAAVTGARLTTGVVYDTLTDGTPLQPKMQISTPNGPVTAYSQYPISARNTAYIVGQRISAIASDNIERWYHCTASGTSAGSAPTFPTSGTVADGGVTWEYGGYHTIKGVLVEPGGTNYAWPSANSSHANWPSTNLSATSATELNEGTATANHYNNNNTGMSFTSGTVYTFSAELEAGTETVAQLLATTAAFGSQVFANFDLINGVVGSKGTDTTALITRTQGNRFLCSITAVATVTIAAAHSYVVTTNNNINAARLPSYTGTNKNLYVYYRQSEVGSAPTSYIPTTTATATRAATDLDMVIPVRATDFTAVIRGVWGNSITAADIALASCGTDSNNRWALKRNAVGTGWEVERAVSAVVTQSTSLAHALTYGQSYVAVMRVSSVTGLTVFTSAGSVTDASWTSLPTGTTLKNGRRFGNTNYRIGAGTIDFISRAFTDAQCQGLVNGTLQIHEVK